MTRRIAALLTFTALLGGGLGASYAQAQFASGLNQPRTDYQSAAVYRFADPGDIVATVNVWGAVRYPGLYEVPEGTHLSVLFSLAGGPSTAERSSRERLTTTLRLIRGERRAVVFESVMENEILATDEDPVLQKGDVMTVEVLVRQQFSWRDALTITAAVASVAVALDRVLR